MNDWKGRLTDLEGAIVGAVASLGSCTAYQVRRAFLSSRSAEWSASTGAVYPALRRLRERGLIAAGPASGGRGGEPLSVTPAGRSALLAWVKDADRATSPGFDPFRTRAGFALALDPASWPAFATELGAALRARLDELAAMPGPDDPAEAAWRELEAATHRARLDWLDARRRRGSDS